MPVYLSQTLTDSLIDQTDAFLNKAVSEWQMLPHHQFGYKPSPEKWSANQCLMHLNSYGRYYLPLMEQAINKAIREKQQPAVRFTAGWLGNYFTQMMLPKADGIPAKKMSAPKDHTPQTNNDSYTVIAEFIEQQEKLLQLLRRSKQADLNKIRIPISIAKFIKLKLGDTFLFLIAHNYRHILQAERALQHAGVQLKKVDAFELSGLK
ncbi:MAG: DinB family protein [Chitinophagaceae bacterium]|nr:MAG: DinB family protein [Chitinophagaceae bacterium]